MRPEDRQARLLDHVRFGWERVRARPEELDSARAWISEHPGPWRAVDRLWEEALSSRGPLAEWLKRGSVPYSWTHEIPLHSVLSSHPFACLSSWSTPVESRAS